MQVKPSGELISAILQPITRSAPQILPEILHGILSLSTDEKKLPSIIFGIISLQAPSSSRDAKNNIVF